MLEKNPAFECIRRPVGLLEARIMSNKPVHGGHGRNNRSNQLVIIRMGNNACWILVRSQYCIRWRSEDVLRPKVIIQVDLDALPERPIGLGDQHIANERL
jgi:hypothetical protein